MANCREKVGRGIEERMANCREKVGRGIEERMANCREKVGVFEGVGEFSREGLVQAAKKNGRLGPREKEHMDVWALAGKTWTFGPSREVAVVVWSCPHFQRKNMVRSATSGKRSLSISASFSMSLTS